MKRGLMNLLDKAVAGIGCANALSLILAACALDSDAWEKALVVAIVNGITLFAVAVYTGWAEI